MGVDQVDVKAYVGKRVFQTIRCIHEVEGEIVCARTVNPKEKCDMDCLLCRFKQVSDDPRTVESENFDTKAKVKAWIDQADVQEV